ncbi:hypothetical protein CRE_00872 [Caenorhabditis remanei]|uniref:Uncharacterized protein n=2 Tax=Caenorhabditis remanei TaxID=31234 RepID=E3LEU0_CAERE|nr:hypothetical protein CRE_00872 [Caenorhabditis remanei]
MSGEEPERFDFVLPPGISFPRIPGLPTFEEMLTMTPLPGKEEDMKMAIETIASICREDFSKPIITNNVCGHKAPGVEMKEGYCLDCYDSQHIGYLMEFLSLSRRVGIDRAMELMPAPPPPGVPMATASAATSGEPSGASTSSTGASSSKSASSPTNEKETKTDEVKEADLTDDDKKESEESEESTKKN